jgi:hypothetical protein
VAYHCGNAANVAPPAVRSQTSLPSQTEPMVFMIAALNVVLAKEWQEHANTEVKAFKKEKSYPKYGD